jgi:molecular chaperone GrpE
MTHDEEDRPVPAADDAQPPEAIVASEVALAQPADEGAGTQTPAGIPGAAPQSAEIEALRRERDDLREALLRRRAEFENFRRRTDRERQTWNAEAEAALVTELVPTLDSLEQALRTESDADALRDGLELIQRELLATLARLGLTVHDPVGQPFDPLTDQALLHEEALDAAEGVVLETLRKGYLFKARLLRPAMVKVAKAVSAQAEAEDAGPASEPAPNKVH